MVCPWLRAGRHPAQIVGEQGAVGLLRSRQKFQTYKSSWALASVASTPNVRRPARFGGMKCSSRWRGNTLNKASALTPAIWLPYCPPAPRAWNRGG